jgi:D-alanyl-D-alanine-carboxypeptidase/D-alanyl-D-alanine-endopeptidase
VWDAAVALLRAGHLTKRTATVDRALAAAYAAVGTMYTSGSATSAGDVLAMNFLMDRSAEHWSRDLAALKAQVRACETTSPIAPTGALSGGFTWRCERGRLKGSLLLAPTRPPRIQSLSLVRAAP